MRSPSCAACSGGAVARWRMYCTPSTEQTTASITNSPRSSRAQAPSGTWQPPCSVESNARSAMMAVRVSASGAPVPPETASSSVPPAGRYGERSLREMAPTADLGSSASLSEVAGMLTLRTG